jgi:hypothetical protein
MFKKILSVAMCLFSASVSANEYYLLEPTTSYIEAYRNHKVYDPYLDPIDKELTLGGNFNLSLNLVRYRDYKLYWNNVLHFDQSSRSGHVKHAGWQFEVGSSLFKTRTDSSFDIFWQHHSRHILEETREQHFPVYDRYGIRFNLLKNNK